MDKIIVIIKQNTRLINATIYVKGLCKLCNRDNEDCFHKWKNCNSLTCVLRVCEHESDGPS